MAELAPTTTRVPNLILERYIASVTHSLDEANSVISRAVTSKAGKTKDFARKIISVSNQIIPSIEGIASFHPITQAVVSVFKAITKLEYERRENDDRIAVTHHSMTLSVSSLKLISNVVKDTAILEQLRSPLGQLEDLMREFGNFTSLYYRDKQSIFRVLRSHEYKNRLQDFTNNFHSYKSQIEMLIGYQSAITIDTIDINVKKILDTMGKAGDKEFEATQIMDRLGGPEAVIQNHEKIEEIARKLGETVTDDILATLYQPLDALIRRNKAQFQSDMAKIQTALEKQKDEIIAYMKMGPHELIKDVDFRAVWGVEKWKNSVKTRLLVDAIHEQFKTKFRHHYETYRRFPPDQWTLRILSKVVFHSSLGDAIDEDSSGYISVHEVNRFLARRPKEWTVPEWLAFWAKGWTETNNEYREQIHERLEEIEETAKYADYGMQSVVDMVKQFTTSLIDYDDSDSNELNTTVEDDDDPDELENLKDEYMRFEERRLARNLDKIVVEDSDSLFAVMGQPRLELALMPLIHVWLIKFQKFVINVQRKKVKTSGGQDSNLEQMMNTMLTILEAFNRRTHEMIRVWRQQRMSVSLQVQCFCGGIFSAWYAESIKPDNIKNKIEAITDGEETWVAGAVDKRLRQRKRLKGDIDQKLQAVWEHLNDRMDSLDVRLRDMEDMLREVLGKPKHKEPDVRHHKYTMSVPEIRHPQEDDLHYYEPSDASSTLVNHRDRTSTRYSRSAGNSPRLGETLLPDVPHRGAHSPDSRERSSSSASGRTGDTLRPLARELEAPGIKRSRSAPRYGAY